MGDDDMPGPGQPEPRGKTDQEIFDEQIARASGKTVVMFGEQSPRLTGDAHGAQLFTSSKPDVGAIGCGSDAA